MGVRKSSIVQSTAMLQLQRLTNASRRVWFTSQTQSAVCKCM